MKNYYLVFVLSVLLSVSCTSNKKKENKGQKKQKQTEKVAKSGAQPEIEPIEHGTFFMRWNNKNFYIDPIGGKEAFEQFPDPDVVMITHIHPDHFDVETLAQLGTDYKIIAPASVAEKLPESHKKITTVMKNGQKINISNFRVAAIPMYNTTKSRKKYHPEGRGNGYTIKLDNYSLYISGDTEFTPEMEKLKGIDQAFLCMNLPYTMNYEQAAKAVLAFQPEEVIPYHYRGRKNDAYYYEDVEAFKDIVTSKSKDVNVKLMEWYPNKDS